MRGLQEKRARLLANLPLEAAVEVLEWQRAGSAQRPHRSEAESSMAPALGQPGPDLAGLQGNCPMQGQAAGSLRRHARAPPQTQNL